MNFVVFWQFDFVVKELKLKDSILDKNGDQPVWVVFSADDDFHTLHQFSTSILPRSREISCNLPFRVIIQSESISSSYMYISLCTHDDDRRVISLGNCRISIDEVPTGAPRRIRIPLYLGNEKTSTLHISASISKRQFNYQQHVVTQPGTQISIEGNNFHQYI